MTNKFGFTLIELLITISITAILLTFGTSSYRSSQLRQALRADVETSLELLQKAKKMAIVGDQDCPAASGANTGIRVSFVGNSKIVSLQALCDTSNGTITTFALKDATPTSDVFFTFKALDGSLIETSSEALVLRSTDGLSTLITVSQAGAITYVQSLSASTPPIPSGRVRPSFPPIPLPSSSSLPLL